MLSRSTSPLTGNFCFLLEGRERVHNIYHKPLTLTLFRVSPPWSARQQHHLAYLAEFICSVVHISGIDNVVVDALSTPEPVSTPTASSLVSPSLPSPPPSLSALPLPVLCDPVLSSYNFRRFSALQLSCPSVSKMQSSQSLSLVSIPL